MNLTILCGGFISLIIFILTYQIVPHLIYKKYLPQRYQLTAGCQSFFQWYILLPLFFLGERRALAQEDIARAKKRFELRFTPTATRALESSIHQEQHNKKIAAASVRSQEDYKIALPANATFAINQTSLAERCEICHQKDQFDAATGICQRCQQLIINNQTVELPPIIPPLPRLIISPHKRIIRLLPGRVIEIVQPGTSRIFNVSLVITGYLIFTLLLASSLSNLVYIYEFLVILLLVVFCYCGYQERYYLDIEQERLKVGVYLFGVRLFESRYQLKRPVEPTLTYWTARGLSGNESYFNLKFTLLDDEASIFGADSKLPGVLCFNNRTNVVEADKLVSALQQAGVEIWLNRL